MYQERQQFTLSRNQLTKAIKAIIIASASIAVFQLLMSRDANWAFINVFGASIANLQRFYIWTPFTYMFLHSSFIHIFFNMLMLYMFGCEIENVLGTRRFTQLYLGSGFIASMGWMLIEALSGNAGTVPCIGASGAVYAIMGAFAALYPDRVLTLLLFFVFPVSMTARTMIIALGVSSVFLMMQNDGNVAHAAHLFGGIAGYLYGKHIADNPLSLDDDMFEASGGGRRSSGVMTEIKAKLRRRTMHLLDDDTQPDPNEVNRILEKITAQGKKSLTKKELETLERASRS